MSTLPVELEGRHVIAYAETYEFMDRIDAVIITEWDNPTPYAVRSITLFPNGAQTANGPRNVVITGSGQYFTTRSNAFTYFRTLIPGE